MPDQREGIEMTYLNNDRNESNSTNRSVSLISRLHLLLAHNEIDQWSDNSNFKGLREPDDW